MKPRTSTVLAALSLVLALPSSSARTEHRMLETGSFSIEHAVVLPGEPGAIFDAITGDITGWWDHTFSENPMKLYIEARPGGGFYEIFDEEGNGVRHATVIAADRGRLLRFEGPLGLSGRAMLMVTTYEFEPAGSDSTRLMVSVHGSGEFEAQWVDAIDDVWSHFIIERFSGYVRAGKHLGR